MRRARHIDTTLALLIAVLLVGGCMIFASAAFGLLARGATNMTSVVLTHLVLGVGVGLVLLFIATTFDHRIWRTYAPHLFVLSIIATALVFVPHIGATLLGGRRWIVIAGMSFQPSEALKFGTIVMASAYFAAERSRVHTFRYGFLGLLALLAAPVILLVLQPDIGTLGVIVASVFAIVWAAGARVRDLAIIVCLGLIALGALAYTKPYIRDRIETFFHPTAAQDSQGYQIKQSLIAIGSGELLGRGWGQGIEKFTYLPEPMGDSIFAVAGEEFGFIGSTIIVGLFLAFALRGLTVAARAPDMFGSLLATGISTYLASEAFINIAAMLGVAPLTGIPLTFVSQGGSAMLASLFSAGVLLSISKASRLR
jgi:cell division protein FtsW